MRGSMTSTKPAILKLWFADNHWLCSSSSRDTQLIFNGSANRKNLSFNVKIFSYLEAERNLASKMKRKIKSTKKIFLHMHQFVYLVFNILKNIAISLLKTWGICKDQKYKKRSTIIKRLRTAVIDYVLVTIIHLL